MSQPIHFYLLLDISASMTGAPVQSLRQGVHILHDAITSRGDDLIQLAVIAFGSAAEQFPPVPVVSFVLPPLETGGSSGLGGALRLLPELMASAPAPRATLVYIFTDGDPTDDWEEALAAIRAQVNRVYVILCGRLQNGAPFVGKVDGVFSMSDLHPDTLAGPLREFL